ncbi:M23 family metallopeptidase [Parasphingorhabdus sp.]|uniref:M23 family metallopeptidase n=1 Tax=Parasphingorhabdus sp. TaxID=2709688 RepID=UPI003296FE4F
MRFGLLALISFAMPVMAEDFSLISPIACALEGPCYIQQYVDHDPTKSASDFTCSSLSYDQHKGTDFALPSYDMIETGVDVLASAAGTVIGLRDGIADVRYTIDHAAATEGRECGNGVVLRHKDGWETQYCHLRQGSVRVKRGQTVKAGEVLGHVGMSGRAAFPHVHLSVRHHGAVVDPFDPDGKITCGETSATTLWSDTLPYRAGGIINIGYSDGIPQFSAIRANTVARPDAHSDAMVIYAFLFGTQKGDVIRIFMNGPEGTIAERDIKLDRSQAQSFRAVGKKLTGDRWPVGDYTGNATLLRDGKIIDDRALAFTLP